MRWVLGLAGVVAAGLLMACTADPAPAPSVSQTPARTEPADPLVPAPRRPVVDANTDPAPLDLGEPAGEVTTLTVVGDVMLGRGVTGHPALAPMAERLAAADITVGNLESTLTTLGPPDPVQDAGDHFHAPPSVRGDLREAGFDVLSLANNHTGDYGDASLVSTMSLLREAGFATFGAGPDLRVARDPAVVRRNGTSFGFTGFNAIGETPEAGPDQPGALSVSMPPRTGPLDTAELDRVLGEVRRLDRRVDVVVVLPHWGDQYTYQPVPEQRRVARALVDAGADLVVGGHPHWVQGASLIGDALVVHSLGNFVFDMTTPEANEGLALEAAFWDDRLVSAELVPYRIGADHAPRVVPVSDAERVLDGFREFSSPGARP